MFLPKLPLRFQALRPAVLSCFFVSGACGLIYQIAWLRMMGLIFGNTTYATCTVLAATMAGLGLGAFYFGHKIDRQGDAVKTYAWLELGVGLYAFITPFLWKLMEWGYVGFYRAFEPGFLSFSLFRFAVAFLALILPTFFMGGTLPVIAKQFSGGSRETARTVGWLYALNTLGAVAGVYLCGFYMLYTLGVWQTTLLAGTLNLLIFYVCYSLPACSVRTFPKPANTAEPSGEKEEHYKPVDLTPGTRRILLILFGVSGGVSMIYEIGWTRVLAISLGSSVYAFSIMLATFLTGIALGSYLFGLYAKRRETGFPAFVFLELLTAIFVFWGLNRFNELSYFFVRIFEKSGGQIVWMDLGRFLLCAVVMLPPTACIGALFACFIQGLQYSGCVPEERTSGEAAAVQPRLATDVGKAYFSNTLGSILGSALTGFLFIPWFGIQKTLAGAAWINAGIGWTALLLLRRFFSPKQFIIAGILSLGVAASFFSVRPWDKNILSSDTAVNPSRIKGLSQKAFIQSLQEREIVFYKEGSHATVSVTRLRDELALAVNGKTDASTSDAFTQLLLGHLPLILKPGAEKVLVIGLGSASTVGAVAAHPVKTIDAVELEQAVIDAAGLFKDLNRDVLKDPRVRLFNNDGRNFLLVSPERYDVIISEPSNPWMAGVANLFSLEHYQTMRKRLNPDGVVCQWLHAYSMSTEDLQMIIHTFARVFPQVSLWTSYYPDLMLIGSEGPLTLDFHDLETVFKRPQVAADLQPYGSGTPESFLAGYWLGDKEVRRLAEGGRINSDNKPILEFSAPRYLYRQTLIPNFKFLNAYRTREWPPLKNWVPPPENNVRFYTDLVRGYLARRFILEAGWAAAQAKKIQPENLQVLMAEGLILMQQKQLEAAQDLFLKVYALNPSNAEAQYQLGLIAKEQKNWTLAYLHFHKAVLLAPKNKEYLQAYFTAVCEQGDLAEAARVYAQLKTFGELNFETMGRMMQLVFQKGELQAQAAMAQAVITRFPRFALPYHRLGDIFQSRGAPWEALKVYQQLVRYFPLDSRAHVRLAQAYAVLHKHEESKRELKIAIRLDPELKRNSEMIKALRAQ